MTAVRYPVAANASSALHAPLGRASRASEAALWAGGDVTFVAEVVGPAFATREAALDAFPGRLDDERPEHAVIVAAEDRFCLLREVLAGPPPARLSRPQRPVYAEGRRWPQPDAPPRTVWRLSISYWRVAAASDKKAPAPAAPDQQVLRDRLERPLTAAKPQKALDIGLFEVRPPEAPHILMPDE